MKRQERAKDAARGNYVERLNDDDSVSALISSKAKKRVFSRVRRVPSTCSSVRGSSVAIGGLRLRRASQLAVGRRRGPRTPVSSCKLEGDAGNTEALAFGRHPDALHHPHYHYLLSERRSASSVSARKLAAALWELQPVPFFRGGVPQSTDTHFQHINRSFPNEKNSAQVCQSRSPASGWESETLLQHKKDSTKRIFPANKPSYTMKTLLKDLAQGPLSSNEFVKVLSHVTTLEEQCRSSILLVGRLHRELDQSRFKLHELLQHEKNHSIKVEEITKKLMEERVQWKERQDENVQLAVQRVQEELYQEMKTRSHLESLHKSLAKEFQKLKKTLGKAWHDLERERKARELMEDVCDELAREIGEDKARVEEMKWESAKVREEVEEERKMLQMAELWREERVQMKLMEAKLELEEKNTAVDNLRGELEAFLKATKAVNLGYHTPVDIRHDEHSRHVQEAIVGHNLADLFHPQEGRVPTTVVSWPSNASVAKQNARGREEDDGFSDGEDGLHSIAISNEMLAKQEGLHRTRFQQLQIDRIDREKHVRDKRVFSSEKYKCMQGGQNQVLQQSKSSQQGQRDRTWIEDIVGHHEWTREPQGMGREEPANTLPSEKEESQGLLSFSPG